MRRFPALIVILVVLHFQHSVEVVGVCTDDGKLPSKVHQLKYDLMCNYDSSIRPVGNVSDKIMIDIDIYLSRLELNEEEGYAVFSSWLFMSWRDFFLKWKPERYNNLTDLQLTSYQIWVPDIGVHDNQFLDYMKMDDGSHYAVVRHDGLVIAAAVIDIAAYCVLDVARWPFDRYECTTMLYSNLYGGLELDFNFYNQSIVSAITTESNVWKLVSASGRRETVEIPITSNTSRNQYYPMLLFNFTVRRHLSSIFSTITIYMAAVVFLLLCSFWLSPVDQLRANLLMISGIGHILCSQYIGEKLPPNADTDVYLIVFLRNSLVIVFIAAVVTVINGHLLTADRSPWIMNVSNRIQNSRWRQFILLPEENIEGGDDEASLVKPTKQSVERTLLTTTCDRVAFLVCLVTYIIMIIVFSV